MWSGGRAVERQTVNWGDGGSIPPTAVSKLRQFNSPNICLCLGRDTKTRWQGFMQDKIIASHTWFGGHMDVNCSASLQTLKCVWWPEMDYRHTCDTIFTHFQGITNNTYGFGRRFFAPSFSLPVHQYFYPSIFVFTRPNDRWTGLYIKLCPVVPSVWSLCQGKYKITHRG